MCPNPHCKRRDWNDYTSDTELEPLTPSIPAKQGDNVKDIESHDTVVNTEDANDKVSDPVPAIPTTETQKASDIDSIFEQKKESLFDKFLSK
jgi:hypothetical protein